MFIKMQREVAVNSRIKAIIHYMQCINGARMCMVRVDCVCVCLSNPFLSPVTSRPWSVSTSLRACTSGWTSSSAASRVVPLQWKHSMCSTRTSMRRMSVSSQ